MYRDLERAGRRDGTGLAPKTVRIVHMVIGKALADAVERGHLACNVADLADPPTAKQSRSRKAQERVWTGAQLRAFLGFVEGDRLYAAWVLFATTGMRRGEVAGLPWARRRPRRGTAGGDADRHRGRGPAGVARRAERRRRGSGPSRSTRRVGHV